MATATVRPLGGYFLRDASRRHPERNFRSHRSVPTNGAGMITRFTILALALTMSSQADTLRLRDGSTVNGSFLGATADDIRFLVNDEVQHYARTGVAEIILGSVDAPSAGPEAPTSTPTPRI